MKKLLIVIIKFYQKYLSGAKYTKCPYIPSCSAYCLQAVKKHGAFGGFILMSYRIIRCNPFSKGGYDPVPEKFLFSLKNYNLKNNKSKNYIKIKKNYKNT